MYDICGDNYEKIFRVRKLGETKERPEYKFLTDEELKQVGLFNCQAVEVILIIIIGSLSFYLVTYSPANDLQLPSYLYFKTLKLWIFFKMFSLEFSASHNLT